MKIRPDQIAEATDGYTPDEWRELLTLLAKRQEYVQPVDRKGIRHYRDELNALREADAEQVRERDYKLAHLYESIEALRGEGHTPNTLADLCLRMDGAEELIEELRAAAHLRSPLEHDADSPPPLEEAGDMLPRAPRDTAEEPWYPIGRPKTVGGIARWEQGIARELRSLEARATAMEQSYRRMRDVDHAARVQIDGQQRELAALAASYAEMRNLYDSLASRHDALVKRVDGVQDDEVRDLEDEIAAAGNRIIELENTARAAAETRERLTTRSHAQEQMIAEMRGDIEELRGVDAAKQTFAEGSVLHDIVSAHAKRLAHHEERLDNMPTLHQAAGLGNAAAAEVQSDLRRVETDMSEVVDMLRGKITQVEQAQTAHALTKHTAAGSYTPYQQTDGQD